MNCCRLRLDNISSRGLFIRSSGHPPRYAQSSILASSSNSHGATAALTRPCPLSRTLIPCLLPRYVFAVLRPVKTEVYCACVAPMYVGLSLSLPLLHSHCPLPAPVRDAKCKSVISAICERDERCVEVDVDARSSDVAAVPPRCSRRCVVSRLLIISAHICCNNNRWQQLAGIYTNEAHV